MSKVSIELDLDAGGFISGMGAASRSVAGLTDEMKKAEKEGRWEDFTRLSMQRDSLASSAAGFKKDTQSLFSDPRFQTTTSSGQTVVKMDAEQESRFRDLTGAIKKLTEKYDEQTGKGELKEAGETFGQLQQKYKEYNKEVSDVTAPPGMRPMQDAVKAIGIGQIANAINDGFSRWAGSLDRSGIVNQYGSGDIMGGRISEERRMADFVGGITQAGLGLAGAIVGSLVPGLGTMAGATVGTGMGKLIDTAIHVGPNQESTEAAYAGLWQSRSGEAMELAALTGSVNDVRGAFKMAAGAAAEFGYSAEEGMDAMKQAAMQGLGGEEAADLTGRVFDYERRTGADRGTLLGISATTARYNAGDALGTGWAGLQASGMKPGQYNEYLRAMQRVMEDGISKGFVRSSEQVARNLTMLSQMTGNNPLWQGENGARRLSEMNAGLEGTTGLQSTSDIVAFRAAKSVLQKWEEQGPEVADKKWADIVGRDKDGNPLVQRSGGYIDPLIMLEQGLTPDLFNEIMMMASKLEGRDRDETISRAMQIFGVKNYNAAVLTDQWTKMTNNGEETASSENMQTIIDTYGKAPPPPNSKEFDAEKMTEGIKNWWTQTGQVYWDGQLTKIYDELEKAIQKYNEETGSNDPVPPMPESFPRPGEKPIIPITDDMSPKERYDAAEQNAITLSEWGDYAGAESAISDWRRAEMDLLRQNQDILSMGTKANEFAGYLYSPSVFSGQSKENKVADKTAETGFLDVFGDALSSGDERQIGKAQEAIGILDALPKDVLKQMDKDQSANSLGNAKDIDELIILLRQIVNNTGETANNTESMTLEELP
jgi:hypothetical protein